MKLRNKIFGITLISMLMLCSTAFGVYGVGDTANDFTLNDAYGNPVSLYDYAGMTVAVVFWTPT